MHIRPATPEDARVIATIQVESWQTAYTGLIPDTVLDALNVESGVALWSRLISAEHPAMVAETNSEVIGFCSLVPSRDGDKDTAEIAALYVLPAHWRRGAGSALCEAAFAAAFEGGYFCITLWVLAGNKPAISFYKALGFSLDGATKTETMSDGSLVPEVRMRRLLSKTFS